MSVVCHVWMGGGFLLIESSAESDSFLSWCVVCNVELTADVRFEIKNVCCFCLHDLEF